MVTLKQMQSIKKFIFVPIGLPGMGKTTLSRYLSSNSKILFASGQ
jgi:adenylate kinase family enzyme